MALRECRTSLPAIGLLEQNPPIGRPAEDNRELVIGKGSRGYVALYRYVDAIDTVFILALRNRREAGNGPEVQLPGQRV